jgi:shikimate dehydrogenase
MTLSVERKIHSFFNVVAVVGDPVSHSLSPIIQNFWLKKDNNPALYIPVHVRENSFMDFMKGIEHTSFLGLNVTLPYKDQAFAFLKNNVTEDAISAQAVNTIYRDENGNFWGDNTDGYGFIQNIARLCPLENKNVLIIGLGGAGKGVLMQLIKQKCAITVTNRNPDKLKDVIDKLSLKNAVNVIDFEDIFRDLSAYDIIINATAINSITLPVAEKMAYKTARDCLFYDINYKPFVTPFLQEAQKHGFSIMNGLGMLIDQAHLAYKKMFHVPDSVLTDADYQEIYDLIAAQKHTL